MGRLESMNRGHRIKPRQGLNFGCRYVERTLGQLGEDALALPLISRHLSECPACRAHRRRVSRVDHALQEALQGETPRFFDGRWESIRGTLSIGNSTRLEKRSRRFENLNLRLIAAIIGLAAMAGSAWSVDHRRSSGEEPIAVAPSVMVTSASVEGRNASVALEAEDTDDGTIYMWIGPEIENDHRQEDRE
jgi:predicted anti-sigma-YlaC factor YlaD